jgi:DNA-binding transcriptional ArsR family regulator
MSEIPNELDRVFEALANAHRREIIYLLGLQPYSIHHLAEIRGLSLPAIHKHIRLLENAGIVKRRKIGRTNFLTLNRSAIRTLQDWLGQYHAYWGTEEETLENYEKFLSKRQAKLQEKRNQP